MEQFNEALGKVLLTLGTGKGGEHKHLHEDEEPPYQLESSGRSTADPPCSPATWVKRLVRITDTVALRLTEDHRSDFLLFWVSRPVAAVMIRPDKHHPTTISARSVNWASKDSNVLPFPRIRPPRAGGVHFPLQTGCIVQPV